MKMVLDSYEYSLSTSEVEQWFLKESTSFSLSPSMTDIGCFFLHHGFMATCYGYNLYLTQPDDGEDSEQISARLKTTQRDLPDLYYAHMLESIVRFIDLGGRYIVRQPTVGVVRKSVSKGNPVIASVNGPALHGLMGDPYSVSEIVVWESSAALVRFVDGEHGFEESVSEEDFLFAVQSRKVTAIGVYMLSVDREPGGL